MTTGICASSARCPGPVNRYHEKMVGPPFAGSMRSVRIIVLAVRVIIVIVEIEAVRISIVIGVWTGIVLVIIVIRGIVVIIRGVRVIRVITTAECRQDKNDDHKENV